MLVLYLAHGSVCFTSCVDPLHQTSAYPDVTFYDMPQEKEFTSSGGHADFDNGVQVTVSANAVPAGTSVSIKVQPSLASNDVFVMPEGIQSASPSYLISGEGQGRIQRRGHATRPILRIIRLRIELFLELPTKTPTRNL